MWTNPDDVITELGSGPFTPGDRDWIESTVLAVNEQVTAWRPDVPLGSSEAICLGATKLAAAMYRRRGATGAEFAEFSDWGSGNIMPGVIDAEIQALIGIGRHHNPIVA